MMAPPLEPGVRLHRDNAAYWLQHATALAEKYRNKPGLTAMLGRMRARNACRLHGRAIENMEERRLWL